MAGGYSRYKAGGESIRARAGRRAHLCLVLDTLSNRVPGSQWRKKGGPKNQDSQRMVLVVRTVALQGWRWMDRGRRGEERRLLSQPCSITKSQGRTVDHSL